MTGRRKHETRIGTPGDPPPKIVRLLYEVRRPLSARRDQLAEVYAQIDAIIEAWFAREDLDELRGLLGVDGGKKRRKHRTAERERAIAWCWFGYVRQMQDGAEATASTADRFCVDTRTVERAVAAWRWMIDERINDCKAGEVVPLSAKELKAIRSSRLDVPPPIIRRKTTPWPAVVRMHVRAQLAKIKT